MRNKNGKKMLLGIVVCCLIAAMSFLSLGSIWASHDNIEPASLMGIASTSARVRPTVGPNNVAFSLWGLDQVPLSATEVEVEVWATTGFSQPMSLSVRLDFSTTVFDGVQFFPTLPTTAAAMGWTGMPNIALAAANNPSAGLIAIAMANPMPIELMPGMGGPITAPNNDFLLGRLVFSVAPGITDGTTASFAIQYGHVNTNATDQQRTGVNFAAIPIAPFIVSFGDAPTPPTQYAISWDLLGGTWAGFTPITEAYADTAITLPIAANLNRANYNFLGWTVNGVDLAAGANHTITGPTNISARWAAIMHTVTWEPNGGTWGSFPGSVVSGDNRTTQVQQGQTPTAPPAGAITRANYTLTGWGALTTITGNTSFIAQWAAINHNITYAPGGASVTGMPSPAIISTQQGSFHALASAPSRPNYTFGGWQISGVTGTRNPGYVITINAATTITATWSPIMHAVTWTLNGGTITGAAPSNSVQQGTNLTLPAITRAGYSFDGWSVGTAGAPFIAAHTITGPVEFIANWTEIPPETRTITWNLNSGNWIGGFSPPASAVLGEAMTPIPTAANIERANFNFNNFTRSDGQAMTAPVNSNITVTANWTAISHAISWNLGGGTVTAGTTPASVLQGQTVSMPTLSRLGYSFDGWTRTPDAALNAPIMGATTFTASWIALYFDITWNPNGGTWTDAGHIASSANRIIPAQQGSIAAPPSTPVRDNYTFAGWSPALASIMGTASFTAQWNAIMFNVAYQPGGAAVTGLPPISQVQQGGTHTLAIAPSRANYTFSGWQVSGISDIQLPGAIITITAATTITATWSPIMHAITWVLNDGTITGAAPANFIQQGTNLSMPAITRAGYSFDGWSVGTAGAPFISSYIITGAVTFVANWTQLPPDSFSITWNLNGGTWTGFSPQNVIVDGESMSPIPTDANIQRANYDFDGFIRSDGLALNAPITSNITITANWTATMHTILWELNGGIVTAGETISTIQQGQTVAMPTLYRAGYTFDGWTRDVGDVDEAITGTTTFTANWLVIPPNSYLIIWVLNGGVVVDAALVPDTVEYGTNMTLPSVAQISKEHYEFLGWSIGVAATSGFILEYTVVGAVTLVANFTPIMFYVTWDANGGAWLDGASYQEFRVQSGQTPIAPVDPSKDGYDFVGWDTVGVLDGDVRIYAQWEAIDDGSGDDNGNDDNGNDDNGNDDNGNDDNGNDDNGNDDNGNGNDDNGNDDNDNNDDNGNDDNGTGGNGNGGDNNNNNNNNNNNQTNMLDRPQNLVSVDTSDIVIMTWDAVEGAIKYAIYINAVRVGYTRPPHLPMLTTLCIEDLNMIVGTNIFAVRAIGFYDGQYIESELSLGRIITIHDPNIDNLYRSITGGGFFRAGNWMLWALLALVILIAILVVVGIINRRDREDEPALAGVGAGWTNTSTNTTIVDPKAKARDALQKAAASLQDAKIQYDCSKGDKVGSYKYNETMQCVVKASQDIEAAAIAVQEHNKNKHKGD